jgi:hypothetical protein
MIKISSGDLVISFKDSMDMTVINAYDVKEKCGQGIISFDTVYEGENIFIYYLYKWFDEKKTYGRFPLCIDTMKDSIDKDRVQIVGVDEL